MWDSIKHAFLGTREYLDRPALTFGNTEISLLSIIIFVCASILVIFASRWLKKILVKRIFPRYHIEIGLSEAIGTIIQYFAFVIGFIIVFESAGIDLSSLKLIAGALGVGIGFGLQNIVNNFVSGILILFERPIKVGDRIEVGQVTGDVVKISARATTVVTNDNISIIVPNSEFTSKSVTNWSYANKVVRFNYPIGISYNEDPERVREILLQVALSNDGVLKNPKPDVLFDSFGDSYLQMSLRVWTKEYMDRPGVLRSQLYYSIFKIFRENDIVIPFPQQDLHLITGPKEPILINTKNSTNSN
ncbi:mechanosensitive ion channel [soil metagenome]